MDCSPPGLSVHGDSPGKNTGGGCHALLLRIFPAQGFNPGLLHAGVFFAISVTREAQQYWSGYFIPSPEELPSPGIELGFPALQADFLAIWATREAFRSLDLKVNNTYHWFLHGFLLFIEMTHSGVPISQLFPLVSWWRICLQYGRPGFDPWVRKILWWREELPTPVFWPGEFHGLHSPWGHGESDTTEQLSLSLSSNIPQLQAQVWVTPTPTFLSSGIFYLPPTLERASWEMGWM